MIMDKTEIQKLLEVKGTNSCLGTGWDMRFYFTVWRIACDLSTSS